MEKGKNNKRFDISRFGPCKEAVKFYYSFTTSEEAWQNCQRGDWMLWIASKLNVDDRKLLLAKALCANTVRHLMKDERSINAVDAAIRYGNGETTEGELADYIASAVNAANDAYAACNTTAFANYAAYINAAYAAFLVFTDPLIANAAAYASNADAYATDPDTVHAAYVASVTKKQNQLKTADICRIILTDEIFKILYK